MDRVVTDNARILLGFIAGAVVAKSDVEFGYRVVEVDAASGQQTLEHVRSGNLYLVSVRQIGGAE